jgi:hypothetical protein
MYVFSIVMLSAAKHLVAWSERSYASLWVTMGKPGLTSGIKSLR